MADRVKIIETGKVTHNVRRYRVEKPAGYVFQPGQANEVSIDTDGWRDEKRPFTFTSLAEWPELEFTIKSYFDHDGVTRRLWDLNPGDALLLREPWGTIAYKGPGVFIAGGAGVTPFIAILRRLNADGHIAGHTLIASNRTEADIILRDEFEAMDGLDCIWTVTEEEGSPLARGRIDADFLKARVRDFSQHFYVCGPDAMVKDLRNILADLGAQAEAVVFEE